jgi:hypothetical protein
MRRCETHIPVADTRTSEAFDRDVIGLPFAYRDPDGHSLEIIAILPDPPDASFIGPYSEWKCRNGTQAS